MFDLFKRRKGRGARRRATPSMFAEFLEYFGEAPVLEDGAADPTTRSSTALGGRSFGDGVFRVFERSDLEGWHRVVSGCFTKLRSEFNLIGYDWMGRCFAVDQRDGDGKELVVLGNRNSRYVLYRERRGSLPERGYAESERGVSWGREVSGVAGGACAVGRMECGGYRIPLFLGGEDSLENMEVSDMGGVLGYD